MPDPAPVIPRPSPAKTQIPETPHPFGLADRGVSMRLGIALVVLGLLLPSAASAGGLYFRIGAGPGVFAGSEPAAVDVSTELSVGTHLRPGLAVGGGTYPMVVPGPGYHLSATGPFVAIQRGGRLHLQAAVLFTAGFHEARDGDDSAIGFGFGAMAGVGYDVSRGAHWSLGPLLRVTYYHWRGDDQVLDAVSPSLLVALTYR
jgi:hypothetical protein